MTTTVDLSALRARYIVSADSPRGPAPGLSHAEYIAGPGLGGSSLVVAADKPGTYWLRDQMKADEETPLTKIGTAAHVAILEPDQWDKLYAPPYDPAHFAPGKVLYESGRAVGERLRVLKAEGHKVKVSGSNAEKLAELQKVEPAAFYEDDLYAEYCRMYQGFVTLTQPQHDSVRGMADAVAEWHIRWIAAGNAPLFASGTLTEQTAYWTDPETGILCRLRADLVTPCRRFWVDLKTTEDASPKGWTRHAMRMGYDLQAAHYIDGARLLSGRSPEWMWLVVEREWPHGVKIHRPDARVLEHAQQRRRDALARIRRVLDGETDTYDLTPNIIELPAWKARALEAA